MANTPLLEICLESFEDCLAAQQGGAQRVELCTNLLEGGTTPSAGMIRAVCDRLEIDVMVMIRPRGGDFLYTGAEFDMMRRDIEIAKESGADGIVLGLLKDDGTVDVARTRELVELAAPLPVTFHRAIDVSKNLLESLEAVIEAGCARVLTSGGKPDVADATDVVAKMVEQAGNRIVIMPGCGIDKDNMLDVASKTGASEFHVYLASQTDSPMTFRRENIPMGGVPGREYLRFETKAEDVQAIAELLKGSVQSSEHSAQ